MFRSGKDIEPKSPRQWEENSSFHLQLTHRRTAETLLPMWRATWIIFILSRGENSQFPHHLVSAYLQHRTVVKVIGTGPSFQGWKGHVAPGEGGNVTEFISTQGLLLIPSCPDEATVGLWVSILAGATVVLVRNPGPVFSSALINGEALWTAGVELETHVSDVKSLSCGTNTSKFLSFVDKDKKCPYS